MTRAPAPATAKAARKGGEPAGQADPAARRARDGAALGRHKPRAPTPAAASTWQDLVGAITLSPRPPRFGAPSTVSFALTGRAASVALGSKSFLVALGGTAGATARLSLTWPDPPRPHAWRCRRCQRGFTADATPCTPGRSPVLHDWECQVSWKNWRQETEHCRSGLTASPCSHGALGLHDFRCKRDHCGHRRLTDVVNPQSSGWLDVARAAVCDPGEAPRPHEWGCNLCATSFRDAIRTATCPSAPGGPPEVHGGFSAAAAPSVRLDDLAERLFLALAPGELVTWIPDLAGLVIAAHHDALSGAMGTLLAGFPVEAPFRASFDAACRGALDPLSSAFARGVRPLFDGLRDAVVAFARRELEALDELFERIVAFLALVGDRRAVLELATQTIARALGQANAQAIPRLWKLADGVLRLATETLPGVAQSLAARLILAVRERFALHRGQVEVFLEDQLARMAAAGHDVLSFSRALLVTLREGVDLERAPAFLVGVTVALVPGTLAAIRSDYASVLGSLFGVLVAAAEDARVDLGVVFGPLIDQVKQVHALTCDEAKLFLSHLGGDALLERSLLWIRDQWERFSALIRQGLAELRRWIDYILGLVEQAQHPFAFPEHDRLVGLLKWLQGLPGAFLAPDQLGDVTSHLGAIGEALRGGLARWITEGAARANTTKVAFVRDFVTHGNLFAKNLRRVHGVVAPILGQASGRIEDEGAQGVENALRGLHDLQELDRRIWRVLFAGGGGEGPLTAQVNVHGLYSDPLEASGATIRVSEPTAFSDALRQGEQIVGGLGAAAAPDASFVSFDVQRKRFHVPHPTRTSPITFTTGQTLPPIPLSVPVPWNAGVAICHLPEFHVIDMRYHFPYGDLGCYHVADLDNDGFVRSWEVRKVREAVTRAAAEDFYDFALDCDGDGRITEIDLALAIEQQQNHVNGVMYRRATSPLGFFVALAPTVWGFLGLTDLTDESIPRGITRRGVMWVADGQLAIPLPLGFKDGQNYYPIRFHYENRFCVDKFDSLAPSPDGIAPPIAPLTATVRWDMVLRGGKTGRDWQIYFTSEPVNPVLLTWNLMGTLYLRGVGAGGVGAGAGASVAAGGGVKGASYIHFAYETSAPLVEVITEWADRIQHIAETKPSDLPVPWAFIKGILEWTDLPRLSRALIQIAGPLIDLLFDWCDEGHHIRGALGYIRQYVLNRWKPAPTWEQLRAEIARWDDVPPHERDAILGAVGATQTEVMRTRTTPANGGPSGDEEPVYVPWLLARACRAALGAGASSAATQRIETCFEDGRPRFAASLDQLVPADGEARPYVASIDIPLCGRFEVLNPFLAAFPVRWQDLKNNVHPSEATLDQILAVRGNPFYKPIYHTVVELGPEAKLFTCPNRDLNYFIASAAGQKGVVEGSRVLEDADGNRWLWIRTDSWHHGWVYIDSVAVEELFSVKEAAEVAGKQAAQDVTADLLNEVLGQAGAAGLPVDVLGPDAVDKINRGLGDLIDKLAQKGARPTVTKIEASPPSTVDESRYARICRQALARRRAGRRLPGDEHIYHVYSNALAELDMRMFGAKAPELTEIFSPLGEDVLETLGGKLAEAFTKLSLAKREKLWAAGTSWLKILEYSPILVRDVADALVPPVLEGDFDRAWNNFLEMLRKTRQVELEDLLLCVQSCAPAVKEVVLTMIDIGIKLKSIKDAVTNKEANLAGAGEVGTAGDPSQVTWKDMGVKILRLLIDDEEEPGRPATTTKKETRGGRKNHDHAISFSFEVSAKIEEVPPEDDPDAEAAKKLQSNERVIALAEPYIVRIEERPSDDPDGDEEGAAGALDVDPSQDEAPDGLSDEEEPVEGDGGGGDEPESEAEDEGVVGVARPGKTIELQITEWGAIVYTSPPTGAFVDSSRVPQAFKDTVGWQVAVVNEDGTQGAWQDVPGQTGDHIRFEVKAEHDGKRLRFRAYTTPFDWSQAVEAGGEATEGGAEGGEATEGGAEGGE